MPKVAQRTRGFGTTVFSAFTELANRHQAVNLGQGFPDFDGLEELKEVAAQAMRGGQNQYAMGPGSKALREAVAEHSARFYGMQVDPGTMVTVTSGATEAIFDAVMALVEPGDEVVLLEPFYDSYVPAVQMAGGTCRYVPLQPPLPGEHAWRLDLDALRAAFNDRTAAILLNTPHNPTGKVFTRAELEAIAELCQRHDAVAICDEVYEHLAFAPARHLRLCTLPGMAERCITLSSAGKTFSLTGWKVGWAIAAPPLRAALQAVHQYVTFATAAPLQAAFAHALRLPDSYFQGLEADYRRRRDFLVAALIRARLTPLVPEGTYFVLAGYAAVFDGDDDAFCRHLTQNVGVAAIPPSAFYCAEHRAAAPRLARFAFCKTDAVLEEAARRLSRWR